MHFSLQLLHARGLETYQCKFYSSKVSQEADAMPFSLRLVKEEQRTRVVVKMQLSSSILGWLFILMEPGRERKSSFFFCPGEKEIMSPQTQVFPHIFLVTQYISNQHIFWSAAEKSKINVPMKRRETSLESANFILH